MYSNTRFQHNMPLFCFSFNTWLVIYCSLPFFPLCIPTLKTELFSWEFLVLKSNFHFGSILECWEGWGDFKWFYWHIHSSCHWEGNQRCSTVSMIVSFYKILKPFVWLQGLMTPIIKNADQKTISAISSEVILSHLCRFLVSDFMIETEIYRTLLTEKSGSKAPYGWGRFL